MPNKNQYQTKVIQPFTSKSNSDDELSIIVLILINGTWLNLSFTKESVDETVVMLKNSHELSIENVISVIVESIYYQLNLKILSSELHMSIYEVLIEACIENMIKESIDSMSNECMVMQSPPNNLQ